MPNAFVQTSVPEDNEKIIMKIRGKLVDILLEIDEEKCKPFVCETEKGKILCVRIKKMLCGMLKSSILCCKKFREDIEKVGYKVNPYDICVANKMVHGKQHTITWHVDDIKSSHVDPKVNDKFAEWCEKEYGSDKIGHVKAHRGKVHDYLGMNLDYTKKGVSQVEMKKHIKNMMNEHSHNIRINKTP